MGDRQPPHAQKPELANQLEGLSPPGPTDPPISTIGAKQASGSSTLSRSKPPPEGVKFVVARVVSATKGSPDSS